jgi:FkbM family methyltransferase
MYEFQGRTGVIMRYLKRQAQTMLRRAGLYHRLKTSTIHDLYRRVADKSWIQARDRHLDFYRRLLPELREGDLIFDVGANEGSKTDLFLRMGARVVAIEPDETNQRILEERFVKYRLARRPVVIVGKAVSDKKASESMWVDGPGSAVNTLSQKWATTLKGNKARHTYEHCGLDFVQHRTVETTTLEELIGLYGRPIFIKIDVEGYELNVIRGLRLPVPYLSFEVNLPEFRPEGLQCVGLLGDLAVNSKFNYAVDCEQGLALERWRNTNEFLQVLEQCAESTIEIFWRGSARQE